jgi:non-homologous end joining protein Ku
VTDREYGAFRYLSRLWRIDHEIKDKEDELRDIGLIQGVRYDRDNVQTSPSDPMSRVADVIGEIEEEKERYIRLKHELINEIHSLEDHVYEQILVERFIQKRSVKQIRIRKDYSRSTAYRLFLEALDAFADKYGNKWEKT